MKVMIAAGGTGGHLYPGIALAKALKGHDIVFVVRRGDLGRSLLENEGFALREISGQGLPRALSFRALTFPINIIHGFLESWSLLRELRPDRVVGMGGYLSIPIILAARGLKIRTLLHEQNVFPGLANRFLSHWADSIAVSFPESLSYFPKTKSWVSGLPIRPDIGTVARLAALEHLELNPVLPTILVFGGSLGARKLNTACVEAWPLLAAKKLKFQVLHITGKNDFDRMRSLYAQPSVPVKCLPYCHAMADAYAAADVVICRAGASTIAELLAVRRPALVIPYPYASNNHQWYNAKVLETRQQGKIVLDEALTAQGVADYITQALVTASTPPRPSPADPMSDAAQQLATHLL